MTYHFLISQNAKAQIYGQTLIERYGQTPLDQSSAVIVLGGDGFMLRSLHLLLETFYASPLPPIYGINFGTVGFLMNSCPLETLLDLPQAILNSTHVTLHPLKANITTFTKYRQTLYAINEMTLFRQSHQVSHVHVSIDDQIVLNPLVGDGFLVSTQTGSTAYNYSAGGPILPIGIQALLLTPLNAYKPKHWSGAIINNTHIIHCNVLQAQKRPMTITADFKTINDVESVIIEQDKTISIQLLFNSAMRLENKILRKQFLNTSHQF